MCSAILLFTSLSCGAIPANEVIAGLYIWLLDLWGACKKHFWHVESYYAEYAGIRKSRTCLLEKSQTVTTGNKRVSNTPLNVIYFSLFPRFFT